MLDLTYPGGRKYDRAVNVECSYCGNLQDVVVQITDEPQTRDYPGVYSLRAIENGDCARCGREISDDVLLAAADEPEEESPNCPGCGAEWDGERREGSSCMMCRAED